MSVVYLPKCHVCGWSMRLVRVCENGPVRKRVFQCAQCRAEATWNPSLNDDQGNKLLAAVFPHRTGDRAL